MWSSVPPLPAAATKDLCRAALPSPATTSCCCRSWLRPWRQDGRRDADKGPMNLFDDNPGPRGEVGDLQDHLADVSESPSAEALAHSQAIPSPMWRFIPRPRILPLPLCPNT